MIGFGKQIFNLKTNKMKQETPLQELINWINSDCTPMDYVLKAKELLKEEMKMMNDYYLKGLKQGRIDSFNEYNDR